MIAKPPGYYFDEVYHAVTAKLIARNDPSGYEWWHPAPEPNTAIDWLHPPFAKLTQAAGIKIFGENALGWRISSVMFGVGVVALVYAVALSLTQKPPVALLAAFLSSLDGLLLAQSRIAMNDIHLTFFVLLAVWAYIGWVRAKGKEKNLRLLLTGLCAGLAMATKWSGVFVIGIFFADQILTYIKNWKLPHPVTLLRLTVAWIVLPLAIYVLGYMQFWLQGHTFDQFKELHSQIWYYQTTLDAEHPHQSVPWQWVLDLRPVWYHVDYKEGQSINIYNLGNPLIFWLGAAVMLWYLARSIHQYRWERWLLILAYGAVWMPWIFSPRVMFFYHYTPAVPFLCIAVGWFLYTQWKSEKLWKMVGVASFLVLSFIWFVSFYPQLVGYPVPQWYADHLFYLIPSWR
jgi:dolichyl-phosphate-mannose-protein mannosyltransferase